MDARNELKGVAKNERHVILLEGFEGGINGALLLKGQRFEHLALALVELACLVHLTNGDQELSSIVRGGEIGD